MIVEGSYISLHVGLNFKLDVGHYRLDQQVACQRYRQHILDADFVSKAKAFVASAFAPRANYAFATA